MDLQVIRAAVNKRPFKAFTISLADGRSFFIPHPELVAIGKRRIIVVKPDDSWSEVEPLLIVSLDYNGDRASKTKRGKGKKS